MRKKLNRTVLALVSSYVFAGALPVVVDAQSFEVASVKINKSGQGQFVLPVQPGGRFTLMYRTLRQLIAFAYAPDGMPPLQDFQIAGGPSWAGSEHFDVVAIMPGNPPLGRASGDLARAMLRTLLTDRFKLVVRTEAREVPVYALVVARSDGTFGPALKRQTFDCEHAPPPATLPEPDSPPQRPCGLLRGGPNSFSYFGVPVEAIARGLTIPSGRPVIDRTGLQGRFDAELHWAATGTVASDAPSVFTAVQEQLGLKLIPARGAVDVLVIARAEPLLPD